MTATKKKTPAKPTKPAAKKPAPVKKPKPGKVQTPAGVEEFANDPTPTPAPVAPPYAGFEPYDVAQVTDDGTTWSDFDTIRTPEDGAQARKLCDLTGVRRYRIVSGDKQTVKVAPPEATAEPTPRAKKAKPGAKPKKMSALDAAARVLEDAGEPMNAKQMIEAMAGKGYWTSPGGKTPHATLYAAICREIGTKKDAARFRKTAAGLFAAKGT
jgi:hypothetical protein